MAGQDPPRSNGDQPPVQPPPGWDELPLFDAAERMGLTTEALRKRIQRGSVPGYKRDGQWYAVLPPQGGRPAVAGQVAGQDPDATSHAADGDQLRPDAPETAPSGQTVQGLDTDQPPLGEVATLRDEVAFLRNELGARRREVQQLHTLLAQAQQLALPAPVAPVDRPDTRHERPETRQDSQDERQDERPDATPQRRSWWKFW